MTSSIARLAHLAAALAGAWPWIVFPLVVLWRTRASRRLDEYSAVIPADAPLVSVVVPARDEARSIARCVRSILDSRYAPLELLVVDDHSTDGTADVARQAAAGDPRFRLLRPAELPAGWMGKQWACAAGAAAARGALLCFTDADTTHSPDLLARGVGALVARRDGLLSVVGRQELGGFWERVTQPLVLAVLAGRYGGTERVTRSSRVADKIANGQWLLVRRDAYDAAGGHGAVRDRVSEDLALAQRVFAVGFPVSLLLAPRQLATRMYTSLGALVAGWRKNFYAGGREGTRTGSLERALFPLFLLFPPLLLLLPPVLFLLGALALVAPPAWTPLALAAALLAVGHTYRRCGVSRLYALVYPAGAAVLLVIVVQAIARGRRVSWKGRDYLSADDAAAAARARAGQESV